MVSRNSRSLRSSLTGFTALALGVLWTSGCANMTTTAIATPQAVSGSALSGTVHGGRQPVAGATVTLWAAGNAGYGSSATSLASAISDMNGAFSFHASGSSAAYTCPSTTSTTTSQSIYLTAVGGTPTTGTTNASAAFMLALGDCSTVAAANPAVIINEVTTVASMFALAQFYSPSATLTNEGSALGTSSTNIVGLVNAMNTVSNLISIGSGTALASTTATGAVTGYTTSPVMTITPEQSKINLMADILAACVNTAGVGSNACNSLYNKVSSPSAIDTLQAAYYMATNPTSNISGTSNISTICGGAVASSPFQPSQTCTSTNPTDWTIGVTYSSTSTSQAGVAFVGTPQYVAVDSLGNVWFTNYSSTAGSIAEISPVGVPLAQPITGLAGPTAPVLDPANNVYVAIYGTSAAIKNSVVEYTGSATNTFTTNNGPQRLAIDGQGNVFIIEPSYKGSGDLEVITAGSATGTAATTLATSLTTDFSNLAIDGNNSVWVTGGGTGATGGTSGYPYVYQFLEQPTVTFNGGGASIQAIANAKFVAGKLTAINLASGGSGYTSTPTVTITGGTGTGATATVTYGTVSSLTLTNGGSGYTSAPTVVFSAPPAGGTSPTATATVSAGSVTSLSLTSPGSGYNTAPTVSFTGGGTSVTSAVASSGLNSGISAITITAAGSGYTLPYHTTPDSVTNVGSVTVPENPISVDNSNNVILQNYGKETASEFAGLANVNGNANSPLTMPAALTKPEFQTADGAGNLWVTQAANGGNVFEITNAGANLSPAAGYARTVTYNEPYNVAIDPSGNVWVSTYDYSSTIPAAITEIIGAAVPVITPIAAGLPVYPGGTNKLATMP